MNNGVVNWSPGVSLYDIERQVINHALEFFQKNKTQTAIALGISIRTLDTRLEEYEALEKKMGEGNEQRRIDRENFLKRQRGLSDEERASVSGSQARQESSHSAETGLRMESLANSPEKSNVSVSVGKEVQGMSPKHASPSHSRKVR